MSKNILDQRSIINRKNLVSKISSISLEKNLKDSSAQKLIIKTIKTTITIKMKIEKKILHQINE